MTTHVRIAIAAVLLGLLAWTPASPCTAQSTTDEPKTVDNNIKGAVGLGLIGAELGLLMPGITGLTDTWAWAVFPGVFGAGGAVAGIFIFDKGSASPKAAVATLAVGMGLAIPLGVLGLSLGNRRTANEEYSWRERRRLAAMRAGPGLVRFSREGTFVAAPGISPTPGRTKSGRRARGGLLSLVSGRF